MNARPRTSPLAPSDTTGRALARFHLDLAQALGHRREALGISIADLSSRTGLSADRLEMIEEGDTSSMTEIVVICNALEVELRIDATFGFDVVALDAPLRLVSANG